jgi:hypothetical protein
MEVNYPVLAGLVKRSELGNTDGYCGFCGFIVKTASNVVAPLYRGPTTFDAVLDLEGKKTSQVVKFIPLYVSYLNPISHFSCFKNGLVLAIIYIRIY